MTAQAAQRLRDAGQAQAEQAADPRIILTIDALIAEAASSGQPFSANLIRSRVPVVSRGLVGARVDAARKRGELEHVGWERSTLTTTRGHVIARWRGKAAS